MKGGKVLKMSSNDTYKRAWATLYMIFSEQGREKEMSLMDSVLSSIINDEEEFTLMRKELALMEKEYANNKDKK